MLWNKPEELSVYLNQFIEQNKLTDWLKRLCNPIDNREKEVNLEILKAIKKAIPYLNIKDKIEFQKFITTQIKLLK